MPAVIHNARNDIMTAVNEAVNMVASTLGPNGKNVLIETGNTIRITKDGHTVLSNYNPPSPVHNAIVRAIKDAAKLTSIEVGDGTTTTTIMCGYMLNTLVKLYEEGVPFRLARDVLNEALEFIMGYIPQLATPVLKDGEYNVELMRSIGMTSSNSDPIITALVMDAYEQVGYQGRVTFVKSDGSQDRVHARKGFAFEMGFLNRTIEDWHGGAAKFRNPQVCVYEHELDLDNVEGVLKKHAVEIDHSGLVIFCGETPDPAIAELAGMMKVLRIHHTQVALVRLPYYGDTRRQFIVDLAAYVEAHRDVTINIGIRDVIINGDNETKTEGSGLHQRIEQLENLARTASYRYNVNNYTHERLARLRGRSAVIMVGGTSREIQQERIDVVEDVVGALRSVIVHGVVTGGGETLALVADALVEHFRDNEAYTPVIAAYAEVLRAPSVILKGVDGGNPLDPAAAAISSVANGWPTALQLSNTAGIILR